METFSIFGLLISLILFLLPIALIIVAIVYGVKILKRAERRADERLKIDKENSNYQKQQLNEINELNNRITTIEKLLKDVE
ncbi:hypothetical protein [Ornithinibacillus halophilus]|uniref:Uncharacterized protein n=1 Tax=Ornithinibacillus halophilus TaxID=930117 RepID=A0A1M5F4D9_9BACI|nr:hypothetical protein [Ornithinibacillus halophilus]SHF86384.1 hypothetical protein SAMN05216225_100749 [Ornithinibacillus halophilus]